MNRGVVFATYVISSQLAKTGLSNALIPTSEAIAKSLGKEVCDAIVLKTGVQTAGMSSTKAVAKIISKELIADLEKIKYSTNPYNINRLTQVAGLVTVMDNEYYVQNCNKIIKTRDFVRKELINLGFDVLDSKANFVFAKSDKISGKKLYEDLTSKGDTNLYFLCGMDIFDMDDRYDYCIDGVHPTELGNHVMGMKILELIEKNKIF